MGKKLLFLIMSDGVLFVFWKLATDIAVWKILTRLSYRVCFLSARIRFMGPTGEEWTGPTFSLALFYVGERPEWFERAFTEIGAVWVVRGKNHSLKY
jgi:hypothetical protein